MSTPTQAPRSGFTTGAAAATKAALELLLTGDPIAVHDPYGKVAHHLPDDQVIVSGADTLAQSHAGIFVDHIRLDLPPKCWYCDPGHWWPLWDATGALMFRRCATTTLYHSEGQKRQHVFETRLHPNLHG